MMFRQISSTLRRASARRLATASLPAGGNPAPASSPFQTEKGKGLRLFLDENKEFFGLLATLTAGAYGVRKMTKDSSAEVAELAKELTEVKTEMKSLKADLATNVASKTELTKVETEVKSLATKEAVGRVQAKVEEVAKNATQDGRNAALEALALKDAAKEGGREAATSRGWFR
jgi:hypothetical protein